MPPHNLVGGSRKTTLGGQKHLLNTETPMGRGYAHKSGCSLARPSGGNSRGRRGRRMTRRAANGNEAGKGFGGFGIDLRRLRALEVELLVGLRSKVDSFIKSKAPALKEKIKTLQATIASIH